MGIKKSVGKKVAKGALKLVGAVAKRTPLGGAVSAVAGIAGSFKGKSSGGKRRSRNPLSVRSIRRFQARLIRAKMRSKITKAEMSAFRGI